LGRRKAGQGKRTDLPYRLLDGANCRSMGLTRCPQQHPHIEALRASAIGYRRLEPSQHRSTASDVRKPFSQQQHESGHADIDAMGFWVPSWPDLRFQRARRADFKLLGVKAAAARLHRPRVQHRGTRRRTGVHSGSPAFRRPSTSTLKPDCPYAGARAIHADIANVGSVSSRRTAASRASTSRPRCAKADARHR
jgi:hypothetical protein